MVACDVPRRCWKQNTGAGSVTYNLTGSTSSEETPSSKPNQRSRRTVLGKGVAREAQGTSVSLRFITAAGFNAVRPRFAAENRLLSHWCWPRHIPEHENCAGCPKCKGFSEWSLHLDCSDVRGGHTAIEGGMNASLRHRAARFSTVGWRGGKLPSKRQSSKWVLRSIGAASPRNAGCRGGPAAIGAAEVSELDAGRRSTTRKIPLREAVPNRFG